MLIEPIAHFHSPFSSKFGIPKQSGLVETLPGEIVFVPSQRNPDALRGLEAFDYLWLIWEFSANPHKATSPVVRPPVLGGNRRMGVFATRSPFRPNNIALSSVRLSAIDWQSSRGPVLHVLGGDLMDGTPIYDIKPYIVYADSHPEARSGFVDTNHTLRKEVVFPANLRKHFTKEEVEMLVKTLELDPHPHYQHDPSKIYGMPFKAFDVRFQVSETTVTVVEIVTRSQT